MQLLGIEWEAVNTKRRGRTVDNGQQTVVLIKANKEANTYQRMEFSTALANETGWDTGDRVTLYKQGTKLFLLKREPVGLLDIRKPKSGKRIHINSTDACTNLYPSQNGDMFEATYDKSIDAVILMPARK